VVLGTGHEVDDDLGVHRRLKDRPFVLELLADVDRVDEVAVVGHGYGPKPVSTTKGWAFLISLDPAVE